MERSCRLGRTAWSDVEGTPTLSPSARFVTPLVSLLMSSRAHRLLWMVALLLQQEIPPLTMKKAGEEKDGVSEMESGEGGNHSPDLETHEEILNLISWAALLTRSVLCCKRTFDDLLERIVQTGSFFASLGKLDQDILLKAVGTNLEGIAASLRPVLELIDLCREPSLRLHLLLQHEEILKRAALLGGIVGHKVEDLINELTRISVDLEQKPLKKAVNAAFQLQHVLYAIDDSDRDAYDKIYLLVQKRQPTKDSNISSSEVSYVNGEPLQLFSEMLVRGALSGATANHRYIMPDDAELKSIREKVSMGNINAFEDQDVVAEGMQCTPPRKARVSVHVGVWTRPQPLSIGDSIITSPRVLWEIDTPTEFSPDDQDSLETYGSSKESAVKDSKGKIGLKMRLDTGSTKFEYPPPPKIQDVSTDNLEPLPYSRVPRRISFIPGQEGGQRKQSYLEGIQSPVQKCRRQSRRSYLLAGEDAPWEYLCPITRELMVDPVTLSTGQTYDRAPITTWINNGHYTCPVTGLTITSTDLVPNHALRHAIGRWADDHAIKLPESMPVPAIVQRIVAPTQRLLEWGQCLPDAKAPVVVAVRSLYRGNSREQEAALEEIYTIAKDGGEESRCIIAEVGVIPALIFLLQNGTLLARELAAKCLRFLCRSTNTMITQAATSGIPFLVSLLHQGTLDACEAAAGALVNLSARNEANKLTIAAAGAIPWLIRMLDGKGMFSSFTTQEIASAALCNLAVNEQNRDEVAKGGAIPKLIQVVSDCPTPEAGEYAAHALGSLSCDNFENASLMIAAGAAEVLIAMAGPGTPWTQEAAARAIRNISFHESLRPALVEAGAVQQLNALLEYSTPRAADAATAALWNLTPYRPTNLDETFAQDEQEHQHEQPEKKEDEQDSEEISGRAESD
ncbi:uncharacterized protein [Physcomitrium patens]|uniref:uncharacterized protein isoform X3 n=1 Tax=Physcomitrium patens TaxID=3218 RepID=UPI003CCDECDF